MKEKIKTLAEGFFGEVVEIRRHIHRHPELSFSEKETSAYVCSVLDGLDIPYRKGFAGTGIVASIKGKQGGNHCMALRAELDALPIKEEGGRPYGSVNPGVMHACGHDVHAASLLGAAMILSRIRDAFGGTVLLVFQPGEEKAPGGASMLLKEGALSDPRPDLIVAQHVLPSLESGRLGFREGVYMASSDELYMELTGTGGHAALPHKTTDIILVASHIITALQQIVSRHAKASVPTVLTFGRLIADGAVNVIPSSLQVEGTFRTMDETWRKEAHRRMSDMAKAIAKSMGAGCTFEIVPGYPVVENDPAVTRSARKAASEYLGEDKVGDLEIRMTAEDFAFYAREFPAVLYRLGVRNDAKFRSAELHTAGFDVDEDALLTGMGAMAYIAWSHMQPGV